MSARSSVTRPPRSELLALGGILALAAALRLVGIGYGLPYPLLNPDEQSIVPRAWGMTHGHLDPGWYDYPSLLFAVLAPLQAPFADPSYGAARAVAVALGLCGVAAAWWLGRRAYGSWAAVVGATAVAVATTHVAYSRMAVTDVLLTLGITCALALAVSGRIEWAGLAVGLAASAKYPGALAAVPVLVAGWGRWKQLCPRRGHRGRGIRRHEPVRARSLRRGVGRRRPRAAAGATRLARLRGRSGDTARVSRPSLGHRRSSARARRRSRSSPPSVVAAAPTSCSFRSSRSGRPPPSDQPTLRPLRASRRPGARRARRQSSGCSLPGARSRSSCHSSGRSETHAISPAPIRALRAAEWIDAQRARRLPSSPPIRARCPLAGGPSPLRATRPRATVRWASRPRRLRRTGTRYLLVSGAVTDRVLARPRSLPARGALLRRAEARLETVFEAEPGTGGLGGPWVRIYRVGSSR